MRKLATVFARLGLVATTLALAAALAPKPALALNAALPVTLTQTVTIQPIVACAGVDAGNNPTGCASTTFLDQYIRAANLIFSQANIGIAAAPLRTIVNPAYVNLSTNPASPDVTFDTMRQALRAPVDIRPGAGSPLSTSPTTINVLFVNTLRDTAARSNFYGFGFIGGNGSIVATGNAGGFTAAVDTMAHELAHNLGLPHPEDNAANPRTQRTVTNGVTADLPFNVPLRDAANRPQPSGNLMRSSNRIIFSDPCQIPPFTCSGALAGRPVAAALAQSQLDTLRRPPIFVDLPRAATSTQDEGIVPGFAGSLSSYSRIIGAGSPLDRVSFRLGSGAVGSAAFYLCPPGTPISLCPQTTPTIVRTASGNQTMTVNVPLAIGTGGGTLSGIWAGARPGAYPGSPFSTEYRFASGITSRAGFDQTGEGEFDGLMVGSSTNPSLLTFDPTAPGVASGPSVLPRDIGLPSLALDGGLTEVFIDTVGQRPEDILAMTPALNMPFADEGPFFGTPGPYAPPPAPPFPPGVVPAPGALAMFGLGLAGLLAAARRPRKVA